MSDKLRALELLSKHLGLLKERVNVTLLADVERCLEAGRQRAAAARHDLDRHGHPQVGAHRVEEQGGEV